MRKLLCFIILFICIGAVSAQQTYTITGIVTDDKDAPIPGATVFIGDSRKVTASDSEGRFTFTQMRPGNYNVVVKMIGYEILQHAFMLQNKDAKFRFKLQESNEMLNTVEINAMSLAERKRLLAIFMECFLGRSKNAAQCKILNTDDIKLRFDKKNNILTANSSEFLIIENKALGYRMKYLLNNFLYDRSIGNNLIFFDGTLFFEDMKGNPRQQKKWDVERVTTYLGSVPHYYRSLFSNTLEENGFLTYVVPNPKSFNSKAILNPDMLLKYFMPVGDLKRYIKDVDDNFKSFNLGLLTKDSTELYVLYTPKNEPADFKERGNVVYRAFKMPAGQLSIIRPTADSLLISRSGDITPVNSILFVGFWGWGQAAAFLPSDYMIPAGMEPPKIPKKAEATVGPLPKVGN
ncbi:carboxypeptidase-like regulatory domain-containing protein [Mucilaginibacter calamicampi]|uniref:Carboxypeptidase-like regulatory domain-containing protein n=1 Tax=Mucilaginibacter calamicampi TaxID=1302352 RepID=A0ABW2YQG2_9SPHI